MEKFESSKGDIERSITEVESGLRILVPSFEDSSSLDTVDEPSSSDNVRTLSISMNQS